MNKGRGANAPVRDWLDRSEKLPSSQKGKPTAIVKPVQACTPNPNYDALQSAFRMLCQSPGVPVLRVHSSSPQLNKANHQPHQSCSVKPTAAPQKTNNHRPHIPTSSGVKGNVAKNNAVQININVHKNHYQGNSQKKPTPVGNVPKPNVARKYNHAPASSGANNNFASQNAVQLNVNVSSNVRNTRPRSNNVQHVSNSAKPKLQCTMGTSHAPANQNKSNNSGGPRRNANSNKNNHTTIIVVHKNGMQGTRIKRIIGGNIINIEAAPYMLSMRLNDEHICGAVIIGEEWGLTAAHCCIKIAKNRADSLYVYSGSSNLHKGGKLHKITQMVRHERYVADIDDDYDICALQVNPPFKYSSLTTAVKLPEPSVPFDDSRGLVSGWGYTEADGEVVSPVLKSITVRRVNLERCKYMYRNLYTIHNRDVCYKSENISGDACEGDSGGPLVNNDSILLGIVSFGDECGYSTLPGVYTDTIQFRNWIKNKTKI